MLRVSGLDHIVLATPDVDRSLAWYRDVLGLEGVRVEQWRRGDVPFPSVRVDAGTIIDLLRADRAGVNVDHFCLVLEPVDLAELAASGDFDVVDGPATRYGARGDGTSLYVRDPDGNVVELRHYGGAGGPTRTTRAVLEDHLQRRMDGDLEGDLQANYSPDVVLLSAEGLNRGFDGVRKLAGILRSYVADGSYRYDRFLVDGEVGQLRWSADDGETTVHDGADSYVVRDERIVAQTIHFSTRPS